MAQLDEAQVVRGSFGSKMDSIVKRIKNILADDVNARILVFSTWVDVLNILVKVLEVNRVPFVFGKVG